MKPLINILSIIVNVIGFILLYIAIILAAIIRGIRKQAIKFGNYLKHKTK